MTVSEFIRRPRGRNAIAVFATRSGVERERLIGSLDGGCQWPEIAEIEGSVDAHGVWCWDGENPDTLSTDPLVSLSVYCGTDHDVSNALGL